MLHITADYVNETKDKRFIRPDEVNVINKIDVTSPKHGQVLVYDETIGKYKPMFITSKNPKNVQGDMFKATYDIDGDGIIDKAKTLDGLAVTTEQLNKVDDILSQLGDTQVEFKTTAQDVKGAINELYDQLVAGLTELNNSIG